MNAAPIVRTMSVGFSTGYRWQLPASEWGVLVWASRGISEVAIGTSIWITGPHQALWIPRGLAHAVRMSGRGTLRQVYVATDAASLLPMAPVAVVVAPLLRELLRRICVVGTLHDGVHAQRRLFDLLCDEMRAVEVIAVAPAVQPRELPMPADPRARRAAAVARLDVSPPRSVREIASEAHTSVRTLERLFRDETGLSLGVWRRRARVIRAMALLADGATVTEVGLAVGYATTSAFVAAFRRDTGVTPGRYAASTRPS